MSKIAIAGSHTGGARSSLTGEFVDALARDWAQHGEAALAKVREDNPATYARLVAELVPKQIEPAPPNEFTAMSDDELRQFIFEPVANDVPTLERMLKQAKRIAKRTKQSPPSVNTGRRQLRLRNGTP